jgi:hypothetical protein
VLKSTLPTPLMKSLHLKLTTRASYKYNVYHMPLPSSRLRATIVIYAWSKKYLAVGRVAWPWYWRSRKLGEISQRTIAMMLITSYLLTI